MKQLFPSPFTDGYCCVRGWVRDEAGAACLAGNEPQAQTYVPEGVCSVCTASVQGVLSTWGVTKHWSSE